jgi:hypothetical protein
VSRIGQLSGSTLLGIALVSAFFAPRLLDYALGVVFLAGAARGLWGSPDDPTAEPGGSSGGVPLRVLAVGVFGLFGGGSIAWGWITAARVAAGVVGVGLLATAFPWSRERRHDEATGCAVLLVLFAATGWLGLFPTYLEEAIWPGTPAGRTARGISGYLLVWLAGLALVGMAYAGARRGTSGPRWTPVVAAIGFGVWLGGALYWCGAFSAEDAQ